MLRAWNMGHSVYGIMEIDGPRPRRVALQSSVRRSGG
jgi:hypothetical protein